MSAAGLAGQARRALQALGADPEIIRRRRLPLHADAVQLRVADMSRSGRAHLATTGAAQAWQAMRGAAADAGLRLIAVSAFRGFDRQYRLIQCTVATGMPVDSILQVLAPPGCSEHHTGRAFDIGTPGCPPASVAFADTAAFAWLQQHARRFGFTMSFPPDNPHGYQYEPWHWCWSAA